MRSIVVVAAALASVVLAAGPAVAGTLQHFGLHDYWVANVGNGVETTLNAAPWGAVYSTTGASVGKTTDGGQTWTFTGVPGILHNEGDLAVAPNGDLISGWLDLANEQGTRIALSTNGGATWVTKLVVGPQAFPDRPWVFASGASPAGLGQPAPYLGLAQAGDAGDGLDDVRLIWASNDRAETWALPYGAPPAQPVLTAPVPLAPETFLDYAKPMGQGGFEENPVQIGHDGTKFVALSGGAVLDAEKQAWTTDFVVWHTVPAPGTWPAYADWPWWDAASDGTIYAVRVAQVGSTWTVQYQWYDGVWHPGAATATLTAKPVYAGGLLGPPWEPDHRAAAVKAHGSLLGVNTRQGTQDVLIRFANAAGPTPVVTKELIGGGCGGRYDFPNLAFDQAGRAITSYCSSLAAYATAP